MVYGGDKPLAELRRLLPDLEVMSRQLLSACIVRYIAYGWAGMVPKSCARAGAATSSSSRTTRGEQQRDDCDPRQHAA